MMHGAGGLESCGMRLAVEVVLMVLTLSVLFLLFFFPFAAARRLE